jgi:hypothetical protein
MNTKAILTKIANYKSLKNDERQFLVDNGFARFEANDLGMGRLMILTEKARPIMAECYRERAQRYGNK